MHWFVAVKRTSKMPNPALISHDTPTRGSTHSRIAATRYSDIPPGALVVLSILDVALVLSHYQLTAIGHKKVSRLKIGKLATKRRAKALAWWLNRPDFERLFWRSESLKLKLTCCTGPRGRQGEI